MSWRRHARLTNNLRHRMDEVKPDQVRRLKAVPGWYVRVSWRYGQVEHVSGFASGEDAQKWIEEKSKACRTGARSGT